MSELDAVSLLGLVFPILVTWGAINDLIEMKIPNLMHVGLILGFCVIAPIAGFSILTMGWHFAVGLSVLAITYALFAFRLVGAGDAKMCATIGLWMGPAHVMEFAILFALFGGALALVMLAIKKGSWLAPPFLAKLTWFNRLSSDKTGIPYGVALGAGGLLVYSDTALFQALMRV